MTRYEHGFIQKCAEYGVDGKALLEKLAEGDSSINVPGTVLGAGTGALAASVAASPISDGFGGTLPYPLRAPKMHHLGERLAKYIAKAPRGGRGKISAMRASGKGKLVLAALLGLPLLAGGIGGGAIGNALGKAVDGKDRK